MEAAMKTFFLVLCFLPAIFAWGPAGHQLVAGIAQSLLGAGATKTVNLLLPDNQGNMTQVASWADQVRSQYPWSAPLHYIDTPDRNCTYVASRDCADNICVAGAIYNYTHQVGDTSLDQDTRDIALKFLIHFIGDIHQPLHVAFTGDRGGNSLHGTFYGDYDNLHYIWDTAIIDHRLDNDFDNQYQYLQYLINRITTGDLSKYVAGWSQCSSAAGVCPDEWASETIKAACGYAYVQADGTTWITDDFSLGDPYYNRVLSQMELQLAKGGVRLAATLNKMFSF
eukprot:TRINITY_DN50_c0_g1_i2.p1 TRINITY_DN50_c0_g1~~TRINITY_DN50_c0_g1_i2.p1  ORF type:complete len:282 (+),score=115.94 TRINITY_DN50_c0_g1_i2:88-933(+)